ncbi:MAG: DegV family protein [Solirubrobacterales bacterium]
MSQPAKTAVVCDSTSYLPAALRAEQSIDEVSLYVSLGGEQKRETEIGDYGAFFGKLRESEQGATTSQPSVGDFIAVYQPHLDAGRGIASIHLSSAISGTFEAANQARDRLIEEGTDPGRIHVYDSRSACGGMGMTVLAACRAAAGGCDAAETVAAAASARTELEMWFAVDTLEYLRKGGRIGAARAWLGSALQIKPILTLDEEVTPVERVRTRRRAFERLMKYARELKESGRDGWVVQHIQDPENAQRLAAEAREVFGTDPAFISEIGPVIGAHTGPGLLGIGGLPSRHLP